VRSADGSYEKHPFLRKLQPFCLSLLRPEPGEKFFRKFNKAQVVKLSPIKIAREVSFRVKLTKGRYILVPSTSDQEKTADFFLSIYFNSKPGSVKITRIDKPEHTCTYIAEEAEDHQVAEWKVQLLNKRKQFVLLAEDSFLL